MRKTRSRDWLRVATAAVIVAASTLASVPAYAFDLVDGAGIRGSDAEASWFSLLSETCGAPCKMPVGDDQVVAVQPLSGQPNWPFHWSSGVSTAGVAGGTPAQATAWIDTNGYVSFVQPLSPDFTPAALPDAAAPHAMVAGAWADLNPAAATGLGGMYRQLQGTSPNRTLVIQWINVPNFAGTCTGASGFTFEITLFESNSSVTVRYGLNPCSAQTAVGGEENSGGSTGMTYFNSAAIPDDSGITYADETAPGVGAPVATCSMLGADGWCRSPSNWVTISDNEDRGLAGIVGFGVAGRAWSVDGVARGAYTNGAAMPVTTTDGFIAIEASAADWAGNHTVGQGMLLVDATPPFGTGVPATPANGYGWHASNVDIEWLCSDATSGARGPVPPGTITGEGAALTASASCMDVAGNTATLTSGPVNIDRTNPTTTVAAPSGWTQNGTLTLSASDNLSGIDVTHYVIDGTVPQTGTTFTLSDGIHQVEFWSVDKAGNAESPTSIQVKVDGGAPAIAHSVAPAPNPALWNKAPATVTFSCSDATSGIAFCSPPSTLTADGAGQAVTGTATDMAGNSATDTAIVNIDQVAPSIVAARVPAANANGWVNSPVTVTYTCTDALSGVASCQAPVTLGQGANQSATGMAKDAADNTASANLSGINVDLAAPTVTGTAGPPASVYGWNKGDVAVHWTCSDALSGVASCPPDQIVTAQGSSIVVSSGPVFDRAGNATTATIVVRIDRAPPSIAPFSRIPAPNVYGWNNTPVTIAWSCADALSGPVAGTVSQTVSDETDGTFVSGTCTDKAGWTGSNAQGPVQIDTTAPMAATNSPGVLPLVVDLLGDQVTGTATDLGSGPDAVTLTVRNIVLGSVRTIAATCVAGCEAAGVATWRVAARDIGPGLFEIKAKARDRAFNVGADSAPFLVLVLAP